MKTKLILLTSMALAVGFSALFGLMAQTKKIPKTSSTNTYDGSGWTLMTNYSHWPTNFLTITNCVWVQLNGSVIVRVTDEEWKIITHHYRTNLVTNTLSFYGK